jgi:hypothetical protein
MRSRGKTPRAALTGLEFRLTGTEVSSAIPRLLLGEHSIARPEDPHWLEP